MGAQKPSWTINGGFGNTRQYLVSWKDITINVSVESRHDKIGALKRVESSIAPDFEEYGMVAVKDKVNQLLIKHWLKLKNDKTKTTL